MPHFLVFGRHPILALAEYQCVTEQQDNPILIDAMALVDARAWNGADLQNRLGGCIKLGDVVFDGPLATLSAERLAEEIIKRPRAERLLFGLTIYASAPAIKKRFAKLPLELKRVLQQQGKSVRWVTGDDGQISPAAVNKLKLISDGYDLVIGLDKDHAYVGLTTHVQNADAWSFRDFGRPARDLRNGMLPPKLARILVNLGHEKKGPGDITLLDPFCGGGTILMEAALLGYQKLIGSDLEARQIADAKNNLAWLVKNQILQANNMQETRFLIHDATRLQEKLTPRSIDLIVTEGPLGQPLHGHEPLAFLQKQKKALDDLWQRALKSFAQLQPVGARAVCVWPMFAQGQVAVDVTPRLFECGYRLLDPLSHTPFASHELIYARPDQHVKRRVVILERCSPHDA